MVVVVGGRGLEGGVMNERPTKVHRRATQSELLTERWRHSLTRVLITSAESSILITEQPSN